MLQGKHFFPFVRLLRALNVRNNLRQIAELMRKHGGLTEELGVEVVGLLLEALPNAENEAFEFLALYTGRSVEELKEAPFEELADVLTQLIQDPSFAAFFKRAASSAQK